MEDYLIYLLVGCIAFDERHRGCGYVEALGADSILPGNAVERM